MTTQTYLAFQQDELDKKFASAPEPYNEFLRRRGMSMGMYMLAAGGEDQISWACHAGGIVTGAVLVLILRRRDVPLLDKEVVTPRAVKVEQPSAVHPVETQPAPRWGRQ
jgi:hypothetical protein